MKSRTNVLLIAVLMMLGAIAILLVRGQKTMYITVSAPAVVPAESAPLRIQVQTLPLMTAAQASTPVRAGQPATPVPPALAASLEPVVAVAPPIKHVDVKPAGYTAVDGDTLSNVAAGLLGSDSKKNRDAVVAVNPSLQVDPNRVLTGQTYVLATPEAPEVSATSVATISPVPAAQPVGTEDRMLKYTAQAGDSLSALAAGLLGADSKKNRDAIASENPSLESDPNRMLVGQTYKIPAGDGMSAAAVAPAAHAAHPATQPDADAVVQLSAGRELRYTARAGDNVSRLASVLLGSDTAANRDAIINNNAALKADPDRVIAGQTYWIPAPVALIEKP